MLVPLQVQSFSQLRQKMLLLPLLLGLPRHMRSLPLLRAASARA